MNISDIIEIVAFASDKADVLRNSNLRLCRLCMWSNYTGFGFNIATSSESPQTIEMVESNSPAAAGGLKIADVILDINKKDMSKASIVDVSKAIRKALVSGDYVELLVMEKRHYDKLKDKNVSFDRKKATKLETPDTMPRDFINFPENTPRTCQLNLSDPSETFGFDLINGPNDTGAFIQEVNPNTPASNTSLRKSDRIVEIDDEFVDDQPYKNILNLIKEAKSKSALKLYVFDTKTYKYYQKNKIPLQSTYDYYKKQKKTINSKLPSVRKLPLDRNDRSPSPIDSSDDGMFMMFLAFFFEYVLYI
jgi:C-terminal processing protease CtpA/Prc